MGWEAFLHVPHPGQGNTLVGLGSAAARLPPEPGWQVSSRQATASALPDKMLQGEELSINTSFRPLWPLMLGLSVAVGAPQQP